MDFILDYANRKEIREYEEIISLINKQSRVVRSLSDDELKNKTLEFKERLAKGETLDDILPEAFAVVREASTRYLGISQYPVQLMGAIALHRGDVAEMKTGEGKTYTAPLAAYLNALTGKGVHIATSNDALATRDRELVTPLFEGLGLTVGVVTEERGEDYKEDIAKRQEAYACDITYGSGNAFAFDYLRDNTTYTIDNVVRGDREVGFIIIDEADQILVNDAVMPFKLSGSIKNPTETLGEKLIRVQEEELRRKEEAALYSDANAFVYKLFKDQERTKSFKTVEEMSLYLGGNDEATEKANRRYTVLYCTSNGATLTERGWLEAFRYFEGTNIDEVTNKNAGTILSNPLFEAGGDYELDDGKVRLTLRGLEKAIREIPDIKNLNNMFYASSEFSELNKAIDNALKAYFVLEKGKEYILEDAKDNKGKTKKKVLLVSNGRTAEGRAYSEGLQQAIELKEKKLNAKEHIEIEVSVEHDELASISQKAFYSIYPKIAGMTGTSAKELFEEIYGMSTVSIPKNSEYDASSEEIELIYRGREDKGTVLFETDSEKMDAVIASVLESRDKGQPVLIATTSVNESNKLYEELKKRGIVCEKLNAEVSEVELENEIISRAGTKGSVTISTQMAGRGTDIKLGGTLESFIEQVEKEIVDSMIRVKLAGRSNVSEEELRNLRISATKFVEEKKMDEIVEEAKTRLEKERKDLVAAGGLKVIGYGHFSTKRDDDQLRGRAARQADPGTTEFYCSVNDLKQELMVSSDKIKMLHRKGLKEGSPLEGDVVDTVILSAQANMEGMMTSVIANTQESDYHLAIMRKKVYSQRMRMLKGESPQANMEFIIESSVVNLIDRNLPSDSKNVNPRKKIGKTGLNINDLIVDVEEVFGIDLTDAFESGQFEQLGDIETYVSNLAKERYREIREANGNEKQDEIDRKNIISTIDNAWLDFNTNLDYIKHQNALHNLVQNKDYDEVFAMRKGFNQSMIDSKLQVVSKMLGGSTTKRREEVKEEALEVDDSLNDYYISEKRNSTNLSIRPAKLMATLASGMKLIKDKIKYQFELVPVDLDEETDKIEAVDFNGYEERDSKGRSGRK